MTEDEKIELLVNSIKGDINKMLAAFMSANKRNEGRNENEEGE